MNLITRYLQIKLLVMWALFIMYMDPPMWLIIPTSLMHGWGCGCIRIGLKEAYEQNEHKE